MNRSFAGLLTVVVVTGVHGQGNFPFPDSAALWVQTYATISGPPDWVWEMQAWAYIQVDGSDTVIAGTSYSQLTDAVSGTYYGAVRDDEGKVWHVPRDSVNAYILYDFTVEPGDTLYNVIYYPSFPNGGSDAIPQLTGMIVQDVYPDAEHEGRLLVVFDSNSHPWIEGIGHAQGLLAENFFNISDYRVQLECMSQLDTIRFGEEVIMEGSCYVPSSVNNLSGEPMVTVYPNPSTGFFIVGTPVPWPLVVLDLHGREVLRLPAYAREIDLCGRPSGVYTAISRTRLDRRVQRLVLMH